MTDTPTATPATPATPAPTPTPAAAKASPLKAIIIGALALGVIGWAIAKHEGYGKNNAVRGPVAAVSDYVNTLPEPVKAAKVTKGTPAAPVVVPAVVPVRAPTVTVYNGLMYAEMGPLAEALQKKGAKVRTLWHDEQQSDPACPDYIIGHSMGGNAAIRQAIKCQAGGHPPKAIVSIDAGRFPLTSTVPNDAKYACASFYNSAHPIGGQYIYGKCTNHIVTGYDHLYMPTAPATVKGILAVVFPAASPAPAVKK